MPDNEIPPQQKHLGRIVSIGSITAALITGMLVVAETNKYPRTDDAEVFANFIGIAPQVDGPITQLAVEDNAFIKQGDPLFQIDSRPYEYALEKARSDLAMLEGQIGDQRRTIASQESAVARRGQTPTARPPMFSVLRPQSTRPRPMLPRPTRHLIAPTRSCSTRRTISIALSRCWRSNL